jgi:hypothetical protein
LKARDLLFELERAMEFVAPASCRQFSHGLRKFKVAGGTPALPKPSGIAIQSGWL